MLYPLRKPLLNIALRAQARVSSAQRRRKPLNPDDRILDNPHIDNACCAAKSKFTNRTYLGLLCSLKSFVQASTKNCKWNSVHGTPTCFAAGYFGSLMKWFVQALRPTGGPAQQSSIGLRGPRCGRDHGQAEKGPASQTPKAQRPKLFCIKCLQSSPGPGP